MNLETLAQKVGAVLKQRDAMLVVAESCTGGWISQAVTSVPGSSQWFDRGFVTYTNVSKEELLGVSGETLLRYGAVSEQTVRAMAEGALARSHAQMAVAVTGVAGPDGGSAEKPVGTVWFAWAGNGKASECARVQYSGDRESVRRQAVVGALEGLLRFVGK